MVRQKQFKIIIKNIVNYEIKGKIYSVGGFDGMCGLMSAECFDSETNTWTYIANMSIRRSSVGVVALNGYLYASIYIYIYTILLSLFSLLCKRYTTLQLS